MSSVPGPIIVFRINAPELAGATGEAMRQVREQAKATSQAVADDWKVKAAQIRASIASGTAVDKDVLSMRKEEVSLLEKTISSLRTRADLSTKELANLKAATLELERQSSFLKGGSGLTAGTMSFANTISGFLSRTAAQIGAGAFGVSGGSQLASGALGGILGEGYTATTITAMAGAATAAAAAFGALAKSGAEVVKNLELVSEKTGISVRDLQVLEAAGESVNVGLDDIVTGFRKFSKALVGGAEGGEDGATEATKQMQVILHDLGVHTTEPIEALKEIADAFQKIPNGAVKADVAVTLFGRSGLNLIPILNKGRAEIDAFSITVDKFGPKIDTDITNKTHAWEAANTTLAESFRKLRKDAASDFLPEMTRVVDFIAEKAIPVFDRWMAGKTNLNPWGITLPGGASAGGSGGPDFFGGRTGSNTELLNKLAKDLATNTNADATALARLAEAERKYQFEIPKSIQLTESQIEKFKELKQSLFGLTGGKFGPFNAPQEGAPEIPLGSANVTDVLGGLFGTNQADKAFTVMSTIAKEHDDLFTTQRDKDLQHYAQEEADLKEALDNQLISQQQYNDASILLEQDKNKTLDDLAKDQSKKMEEEAGKLFDDLLSGHGKNFGKRISEDLIKIFTEPLKKQFETEFKNIFGPLVGGSSTGGTTGATGAAQTGVSGWLAKILGLSAGGFGGTNAPGGTPGYFPGSIGLGGGTGSGAGAGAGTSTGQFGVATMNVTAGIVNITGGGIPGLGGTGTTGIGDIPFPDNAGSADLGPYGGYGGGTAGGGTGASGIGGVFSSLGPFIGAGAMVGAGIMSKSPTAIAMGMSSLAKGGIAQIIKNSPSLGGTGTLGSGSFGLGSVAGGLGGVALFGAGVAQGGVGGTLEATAGGAMAGMAFGGPIGAAIGAGVGLISGVVSSLIQGPSFASRVKHDMANQAYRLPPSETFSFAEGSSIGQTLSTGAVQSGSTFSAFGLPANTPFWANPVVGRLDPNQQRNYLLEQMGLANNQPFEGFPSTNPFTGQDPVAINRNAKPGTVNVTLNLPGLIDAASAGASLAPLAATLAQHVGRQITNSSSAMGANIRKAAFLP